MAKNIVTIIWLKRTLVDGVGGDLEYVFVRAFYSLEMLKKLFIYCGYEKSTWKEKNGIALSSYYVHYV